MTTYTAISPRRVREKGTMDEPLAGKFHGGYQQISDALNRPYQNAVKAYNDHIASLKEFDLAPGSPDLEVGSEVQGEVRLNDGDAPVYFYPAQAVEERDYENDPIVKMNDAAAGYATDAVSDKDTWTANIQLKYNGFIAGAQWMKQQIESLKNKQQ
jgi:hypothetical protein